MSDAETIMGATGIIYVCAECGEPVESEPCKEHQPAAYLAGFLAWAKPGARCKVPGFEDWIATPFNGWRQEETGWMVTHGFLADLMVEAGFRYDFEADGDRPDPHVDDCPACDAPLSSCSRDDVCCGDCTHVANWSPAAAGPEQ